MSMGEYQQTHLILAAIPYTDDIKNFLGQNINVKRSFKSYTKIMLIRPKIVRENAVELTLQFREPCATTPRSRLNLTGNPSPYIAREEFQYFLLSAYPGF